MTRRGNTVDRIRIDNSLLRRDVLYIKDATLINLYSELINIPISDHFDLFIYHGSFNSIQFDDFDINIKVYLEDQLNQEINIPFSSVDLI